MEKIKITIKKEDSITNEYNPKYLKPELEDYIINCAKQVYPKESINLDLSLETNLEQKKIENIIHYHFEDKYLKLKRVDHYDDYYRLILLLLGIILIIISEALTAFISEIFLIAGWVVIWEMVYDVLFTGLKRKREQKIYKKLANCEITFS